MRGVPALGIDTFPNLNHQTYVYAGFAQLQFPLHVGATLGLLLHKCSYFVTWLYLAIDTIHLVSTTNPPRCLWLHVFRVHSKTTEC
jgi:hypothetical protein